MAASDARLLTGTASWTDKPLIESGTFYPPGAKDAEARLRYYASQFPLVEADTTYYGLPTEQTVRAWVDRTPDGFTFDVKAYSLFTDHPTPVARLPKAIQAQLPSTLTQKRQFYRKDAPPEIIDLCWSTFVDALRPLHESGRLGAIVFQFPKWVFPGDETLLYFEEIRDRLGPYRAAIEFRNATWMEPGRQERTLAELGDLDFSYICVDEPQGFQSSVPPVAAATNDLGFVRFHGRNAAMWEQRTKTSSERFDHYYQPQELDEWVPKIASLLDQTESVHLILNTNNFDQGPTNARLLTERLEAGGVTVAPWTPPAPEPAAAAGQGRLL
ncbi:MAG: DUF72 domain-containing protein [Dehalococcoidia bacterium]